MAWQHISHTIHHESGMICVVWKTLVDDGRSLIDIHTTLVNEGELYSVLDLP
jgi:hypothetical protein